MGYGYYVLPDGREAGYAVDATCDQDGCGERIDRGLGYLCGDEPGDGGEHGCGRYFCGSHLYSGGPVQLCESCLDAYDAKHGDGERKGDEP